MQRDPIGLLGGVNVYGYGEQKPTKFIDPTGELAILAPLVPVGSWIGANWGVIGAGVAAGAIMSMPGDSSEGTSDDSAQCEDDNDECGPLTRRQAYAKAQMLAQIPRKDRGYSDFGDISSDSNRPNRGPNCGSLQSAGATHVGYYCEWNARHRIEDHPDGHSHLPGESHHSCPHLHVYDRNGDVIAIIPYKRNS